MEVTTRLERGITLVELSGELTWTTAPEAQQRILEQARPNERLILDMSRVTFMASAGLRMLLVVYRTVAGQGGRAVLVGLSENLRNTMEVTGFLDFFTHCESLEAGIAALTS